MKLSRILDTSAHEASQLIAAFCTPQDHDQAGVHSNGVARTNRLVARALARELLLEETGTGEWLLQTDARGKPFVVGTEGAMGPFVSFSHARNRAVAAIDLHHPIGVDIEHWRPRNFAALAAYAFGLAECEEVARHGAQAFYRIWCIREAMAKATGDGVMAHMNGTDSVRDFRSDYYEDGMWKIIHQTLDHYSLATAQLIK